MASAIAAAKAVNSFLHFSSKDQEALRGVMEDYFTTPCETGSKDSDFDSDLDLDSEPELEPADPGTYMYINTQ